MDDENPIEHAKDTILTALLGITVVILVGIRERSIQLWKWVKWRVKR